MTAPGLLQIEELSITYSTRFGEVPAVHGVSLCLAQGESLGLVGESGCGKSTLALAIMAYLAEDAWVAGGRVRFRGQDISGLDKEALRQMRGGGAAMVFQEPGAALNPSMRVGEQIAEAAVYHSGGSWAQARAEAMEMLRAVGLSDVERILRGYPHQLSGGQQQRVVIAMALLGRPSLLILDEPTTNLDVTVEASVIDLIGRLRQRHSMGLLYISHNLGLIAQVCERVAVMYAGEIVEQGLVRDVFKRPLHPYTSGLLQCIPKLDMNKRARPLQPIRGQVAHLRGHAPGCAFAPRCDHAVSGRCDRESQAIMSAVPERGHDVRCWRWAEITVPEACPFSADRMSLVRGETLLAARNVDKHYKLDEGGLSPLLRPGQRQYVKANDNITLEVGEGETVAIVGESGSGKSTFAKIVMGLERATGGSICFGGADVTAVPVEFRTPEQRRALQIVFQNPDETLNPFYNVGAQIGRVIKKFGIARRRREVRRDVGQLLRFTHLPEAVARRRPHQLSGGQKQRVAIARAFAGRPTMVVADEPVSALDVSVRAAITELLIDIQRKQGTALLVISHDLGLVRYMADRVVVLYLGRVMESGTTEEVFSAPNHPYTEALLSAVPVADTDFRSRRIVLEGELPSALAPPGGCPFHTRCHRKLGAICETEPPPEQRLANGSHRIACHIPAEQLARTAAKVESTPP